MALVNITCDIGKRTDMSIIVFFISEILNTVFNVSIFANRNIFAPAIFFAISCWCGLVPLLQRRHWRRYGDHRPAVIRW